MARDGVKVLVELLRKEIKAQSGGEVSNRTRQRQKESSRREQRLVNLFASLLQERRGELVGS